MDPTPRYQLPLLQAGQAQKEIAHNDAIARIDALLHLSVESRSLVAAPSSVIDGAWIVASNATGTWQGRDGAIAVSDDAGWQYVAPRDGCVAYVRDEAVFLHWANGRWQDSWPTKSLLVGGRAVLAVDAATVALPSGGATVDNEARAVIGSLINLLRAAGLVSA